MRGHPSSAQPSSESDSSDLKTQARQRWISILSRSSRDELEFYWNGFEDRTPFTVLRAPETGLVMVRGRAGGTGGQFNLGEATITRCTVQLESGETGHAWVCGRSQRHAELAAAFDACLQSDAFHDALETSVIVPIEERLEAEKRHRQEKVAATKVDFFTMVRGED